MASDNLPEKQSVAERNPLLPEISLYDFVPNPRLLLDALGMQGQPHERMRSPSEPTRSGE